MTEIKLNSVVKHCFYKIEKNICTVQLETYNMVIENNKKISISIYNKHNKIVDAEINKKLFNSFNKHMNCFSILISTNDLLLQQDLLIYKSVLNAITKNIKTLAIMFNELKQCW